jgi:SAM-dependent methyltransferase
MTEHELRGTTNQALSGTAHAFDRAAARYDVEVEPNPVLSWMRGQLWSALRARVRPGARLLDLGCGSGIDAVQFAQLGYQVTAIDWSSEMCQVTRARAGWCGVQLEVRHLGIHQLANVTAAELGGPFDALYSDLGPFNCVPDVPAAAAACARLMVPGGWLLASVMGRYVPWEHLFYLARMERRRAFLRWQPGPVPVGLAGSRVSTWYYTPAEFLSPVGGVGGHFRLEELRGLGLFQLPPYLLDRFPWLGPVNAPLRWLDERLGDRRQLAGAGDHFLAILRAA